MVAFPAGTRPGEPGTLRAAPENGAMVRPHHHRALPMRVGTRGSPLALWQTREFMALLTRFCPVLRDFEAFQEHVICTTGDATQASGVRLADLGGKGLFAKEIHEALADGRIDFAVHSLKDLETELPPGIVLACTLRREDARDALILPPGDAVDAADDDDPWACLPQCALVGTSSVRRQAQLLHARPDLRIEPIRGNVATRLGHVAAGRFEATLLALAGLRRLKLEGAASLLVDPAVMLPAACQGIVGVTCREADVELRELLAAIEDPEARAVSTAERALLRALDGSCRTPIGGHARRLADGRLELTGLVARADGSFLLRRSVTGAGADAARMGAELGRSLWRDAPCDVFA